MDNKAKIAILRGFWELPWSSNVKESMTGTQRTSAKREISARVGMGNWIQGWSLPQVTPRLPLSPEFRKTYPVPRLMLLRKEPVEKLYIIQSKWREWSQQIVLHNFKTCANNKLNLFKNRKKKG